MSIVQRLRARREPVVEQRAIWGLNQWPAFLESLGGPVYQTGAQRALTNAASWACINVLTDAIARTPLDVVRYQGDVRVAVRPTPRIVADPSAIVTSDVWQSQLAWSLVAYGNAYGQVVRWAGSYPDQIELLDPAIVTGQVVDGRKVFLVNGVEHFGTEFGGDLWHVPGRMVRPGDPFGLSPMDHASKTIGLSLAAEDFSNRFFSDGGHPTWGLSAETDLTAEQAAKLKSAFVAAMKPGAREPFVHGSGVKPEQFSVQPGETQFIDLMRFCVEQACRFWAVPPAMVYAAVSGQNVTYANVTDADLSFLKHSLDGYFVRIEQSLTRILPRPQVVRANRNAILRSDVKARFEVYDKRLRQSSMTVNEVRALEDEQPFDDPAFSEPGIPVSGAGPVPDPALPGDDSQDDQ